LPQSGNCGAAIIGLQDYCGVAKAWGGKGGSALPPNYTQFFTHQNGLDMIANMLQESN